jgi:hypothetical protein
MFLLMFSPLPYSQDLLVLNSQIVVLKINLLVLNSKVVAPNALFMRVLDSLEGISEQLIGEHFVALQFLLPILSS